MDYYNVRIVHDNRTLKLDEFTTLQTISKEYSEYFKGKIMIAKVNNTIKPLSYRICNDCQIEFFDITNQEGMRTYRRSTTLIMSAAVNSVLGENARVWVEHTINNNFFCQIDNVEITDELLQKIEDKMRDICKADYVIEKIYISKDEGLDIFKKYGLEHKIKSMNFVKLNNINLYKVGNFYDYMYGDLVPETSYIDIFKLTKFNNGFLLSFASAKDPAKPADNYAYPKLAKIFDECTSWARILNINTAADLNELIAKGEMNKIILVSEALQEKKLASIADDIVASNKRLIMIAGPSSSGKTTFAKRLSIQLTVLGKKPYIISLDDYYRNRVDIPLDDDGTPNFEVLEALNVKRFNEDLLQLLNGSTVDLPIYDFYTGTSKQVGRSLTLGKEDVLIVEGIHGLNEKLTPEISRDDKFKVYISALTQLNIDEHNRISTTDTRKIRRIVRDYQFRGFSAESTINMWQKVAEGEEKYIFPFQEEADAMFNSSLIYELGVLKTFAEPVLFNVSRDDEAYIEATRLLNFLNSFLNITTTDIPKNSLLREFIGGGCF